MFIHFDEAREAAARVIREWVEITPEVSQALLVIDLSGFLRLVVWSDGAMHLEPIDAVLAERCGMWWRGPALIATDVDEIMRNVYVNAFRAAAPTRDARFAIADRHRSRTAWFADVPEPVWAVAGAEPPVVVFYSFKGGMGRSTTLASFAIQRAQAGERVCVIDLDLDSPGAGFLLNHGDGITARWGVVDFLLDLSVGEPPLNDYFHRCDRAAGAGEIVVFPAGTLDGTYVQKLARVDLEETPVSRRSGISALLRTVRDALKPRWILVDARTGVSEVAGYLLSGIAHLHVLLGTEHDQSWRGLSLILDRLGRHRVISSQSQSEVLLVHAMVPAGEAGRLAKEAFAARAELEFTARYYAEAPDGVESETLWDVRDIDSSDAPHVSVGLEYDPRLATFRDVQEIIGALSSGSYATLNELILGRFAREN